MMSDRSSTPDASARRDVAAPGSVDAGRTAEALLAALAPILARRAATRPVIALAGESGSGKTVTAAALAALLDSRGDATVLLHQDDYFVRPPRTNHEHRRGDLASVGPGEIRLDLLARHVAAFRAGEDIPDAPRVDYPNDRFVGRELKLAGARALVVEGTYALSLPDADARVFFEATHAETRIRRAERARDIDEPFVDEVLAIEHLLIAPQRARADVLVTSDFGIRPAVPGRDD